MLRTGNNHVILVGNIFLRHGHVVGVGRQKISKYSNIDYFLPAEVSCNIDGSLKPQDT